jgi:hypothetical protein
MSDTPRMQSALLDAPDAGFAKIWQVGCDIERELNESNQIIRQQQLLDEENLRLKDRIKRLEDTISRAAFTFFRDGSDRKTAIRMLEILDEERKP